MMLNPRYYQLGGVHYVHRREAERPNIRLGLYGPTGSGKTLIMSLLLQDPIPQLVLTHRCILRDQLAAELDRQGIAYGIRASGFPLTPAPIQLAMIQSEYARAIKSNTWDLHNPKRIHVDEPHAIRGQMAVDVLRRYQQAGQTSTIGYTASPVGLGDLFDDFYTTVSIPELIAEGYLVPPRLYGIEQPSAKKLAELRRDASGEYSAQQIAKLVMPKKIFGRVIENYLRLRTEHGSFILYAHSVKTSIWWAQHLTGYGLPTAHLDGANIWVDGEFHKSTSALRQQLFKRIRDKNLIGLSNRFVLREGIDLACIGHVILTAPVGSRVSFVQMCGRALRPYPGKREAIIQCHSGSIMNHPSLDQHIDWPWNKKQGLVEREYISRLQMGADREPLICPQCKFARYFGDTCPQCGFKYNKYCRFVIQTDGSLQLMSGKNHKTRKTTAKSGDEQQWERAYWAAYKNNPKRTFEQVYCFLAVKNNWRWLPRTLPLMPRDATDWRKPVGDVPQAALIS